MSADLIIRLLTPDLDWDSYLDLTARFFGPSDEARVRANIGPIVADGRCLGAFERDRMVGTAMFYDMRQWWHGRAVPMAGVAGVKVAPEDRGRGIGRAVMTALVELMAVRGYPMAALYPKLDAPAAGRAGGHGRARLPATDLAVPLRITDDLRPANSGLWQLTVRDGAGCLSGFRTGHGGSPRSGASLPAQGPAGEGGFAGAAPPACPRTPLSPWARGLAALYAGTPVAALRRAGLASGGSPAADAALDGAFAATPFMLDSF